MESQSAVRFGMEISGADVGSDAKLEEELGDKSPDLLDKSDKSKLIADGADVSDGFPFEAFCCANWREYSISLSSFSCSFMD